MKCRSVACIWSGTPPAHKITAAATLNHPPTLYTGGSDGSILWWSVSSSGDNTEIKPVAMLCGHAAPIADLSICYPVVGSGNDHEADHLDGPGAKSSDTIGALFSACKDGVLCVWSRGSGHCRRRRKLPPWVGYPSIVRTLPMSPRYVCISCCLGDAAHFPDQHTNASLEGGETEASRHFQHRKPQKCTVVIVDTYSLTIVQTVFHGNLSIGPLKFMDVVLLGEDGEKHSVFLVDCHGRVQLVSLLKDSNAEGDGGNISTSLQSDVAVWRETLSEGEQVVSIATHGNLIAILLESFCIFRLLTSGTTIGKIFLIDNLLCVDYGSTKPHALGCMFLERYDYYGMHMSQESYGSFIEHFVAWNSRGSAVVYVISYLNERFSCESLCQIPAAPNPIDLRQSISFMQLSNVLFRIGSVCLDLEEPVRWRPQVTLWSLDNKCNIEGKLFNQCKMLGESNYFSDWTQSSGLLHETNDGEKSMLISPQGCDSNSKGDNGNWFENGSCSFLQRQKAVSSSMVICENFYAPYAAVYGFSSGEIEVIHFDMFLQLDPHGESPCHGKGSRLSRKYFSGHTGAILCLAAHRMRANTEGWSFHHILVSGSQDCMVRLWNLDTDNLIIVMHQHVAPVRQIIFPPLQTERPWSDCFLSVGEDQCIALVSLETLRVERMFPGHPSYPEKVLWDGKRGYVACLCQSHLGTTDAEILYIWDVKTGAQERVIRGMASHSMLDNICKGISASSIHGSIMNGNTSVSSLLLPIIEDGSIIQPESNYFDKASSSSLSNKHAIRCTCPFPGIATFSFDLESLMFSSKKHLNVVTDVDKQENTNLKEEESSSSSIKHAAIDNVMDRPGALSDNREEDEYIRSLEECILRFSLSFLHLWSIDGMLDKSLITEMKLKRPDDLIISSGLQGDKGSLTLAFPGFDASLELLKSSSEFSAMRSLTIVSIAQRMISLNHSSSSASSAMAAFYTRNFFDKVPEVKPPLLQLLVGFWQDASEHVRMAARTLFHCTASRSVPNALCSQKANDHVKLLRSLSGIREEEEEEKVSELEATPRNALASGTSSELGVNSPAENSPDKSNQSREESQIVSWFESFEVLDWISCVGGTSQDAMTSHIIVAAALAVWYPSLVKPSLARLVVHPLIKLVMAMNEKYSSTAAELLAEGMESTWKACNNFEISRLIVDILFQVECLSGPSANTTKHLPAVQSPIRETLVGVLLPSLAMADLPGFLNVIESQIWSTASDSPVHVVSLMTLIRVVRGASRCLVQYLDKVINFILLTMDPGNLVMRKACLQSSMTALKEVARVYPMVALNAAFTRLAVGNAIGDMHNASISVYDIASITKVKVLDASGPPGVPNLLSGASESVVTTMISALSFSPDGEGLVAFSEYGLMIRWWSLGSVWWEKLSRNFVPVQCSKLIFVPPWEGMSPKASRSSIIASITASDKQTNSQDNSPSLSRADSPKMLMQNVDLAYRLQWVGDRKVLLTRHGVELGTFPLSVQ